MIHCIMDKMAPNIGPEVKRCPFIVEITSGKKVLWEWHGEEHIDELTKLCGIEFPVDWETRIIQEIDEKKRWDERIQVQGIEECFNRLKNLYPFDWAHNNICEVLPSNPTAKKDWRSKRGIILLSL